MTRVGVTFSMMLAAAGIAVGLQSTPAEAARYTLTFEDAKQICHQLDGRFYGTEKTRYGCERLDRTRKRVKIYECTGSVCYGIATRNLRAPKKPKRPTPSRDWQMISERGLSNTGTGGEGGNGGGGGGGGGTGR